MTPVSGIALPSTERLVDCQVRRSASTLLIVPVPRPFLPSRSVAVPLTVPLSPSRLQSPSVKLPLELNDHERMRLAAPSQPIHCVPPATGTSLRVVANDETRKLSFS